MTSSDGGATRGLVVRKLSAAGQKATNWFARSRRYRSGENSVTLKEDYRMYIMPNDFQAFDQGGQIEQKVYCRWELEIGDRITWFTEKLSGLAEVVAKVNGDTSGVFIFKKVS